MMLCLRISEEIIHVKKVHDLKVQLDCGITGISANIAIV